MAQARGTKQPISLALSRDSVYLGCMKRIHDIDDRAFLPWRFHGQSKTVIAAL
ncbi:hypothetical protein N6L24_13030 [Cognatishimia sp. SS12]|nr:hypothetical protein [Cognatishimia sp. SS12]